MYLSYWSLEVLGIRFWYFDHSDWSESILLNLMQQCFTWILDHVSLGGHVSLYTETYKNHTIKGDFQVAWNTNHNADCPERGIVTVLTWREQIRSQASRAGGWLKSKKCQGTRPPSKVSVLILVLISLEWRPTWRRIQNLRSVPTVSCGVET